MTLHLYRVYIKEHDLQSEKDKRVIVCDEMLKPIMGGNETGMLEINDIDFFPTFIVFVAAKSSHRILIQISNFLSLTLCSYNIYNEQAYHSSYG